MLPILSFLIGDLFNPKGFSAGNIILTMIVLVPYYILFITVMFLLLAISKKTKTKLITSIVQGIILAVTIFISINVFLAGLNLSDFTLNIGG